MPSGGRLTRPVLHTNPRHALELLGVVRHDHQAARAGSGANSPDHGENIATYRRLIENQITAALDEPAVAGGARSGPLALAESAGSFMVIDEIEHAPELFPAIKRVVDEGSRHARKRRDNGANQRRR